MIQFTATKALISVDPYLTICMLISLYVQYGDFEYCSVGIELTSDESGANISGEGK